MVDVRKTRLSAVLRPELSYVLHIILVIRDLDAQPEAGHVNSEVFSMLSSCFMPSKKFQ